jgi:hypothetical protein
MRRLREVPATFLQDDVALDPTLLLTLEIPVALEFALY